MNIFSTRIILSLALGGVGTGGAIVATMSTFQKKIGEMVGDDLFTNNEQIGWTKLKNILDSHPNSTNLESLEEIRGTSKGKMWNDLKTWCSTNSSVFYRTFFPSQSQKLLLDLVKKFCVLKIEKRIEENKIFKSGEESKEDLKIKVEELNEHSQEDEKLEEEQELKKIKDNYSDKEKDWSELRDWCLKAYKRAYKGETTNLWKLAKRYCSKE